MLITDKQELKKYTAEHRLWQGIPGIEVTEKGRIFVCFYSGGVKEQLGNYAVLIMSDDGVHFEDPVAVAWEGEEGRCYDPCLWMDPLGRLWFIWADLEHGVCASICDNPHAEELVWGEEFVIGYDVMLNKPTVLSTGEWLFPVAVWNYGIRILPAQYDTRQEERGSFVYRTTDQGRTFEKLGAADVPQRSFDEHMILERGDGSLALYVRTSCGLGVSYSYDRGLTWTPGEHSGIWGPDTRFHIRRLPSGRVLLINHLQEGSGRGRKNLVAMLSEDEGQTWKYELLLDERDKVSYPDVSLGPDGSLYIVYDRERGCFLNSMEEVYREAREVLCARIREEDIIAGRLVSENSRLKCLISRLEKYEDEEQNPFEEKEQYSDEEFAGMLLDKYPDAILDKIFEFYPVPCVDLQKLERDKLDALAEKLEKAGDEKLGVVLEIITYARSITDQSQGSQPMVERIKDLILQNSREDLSVREIADKVGSSMYYMMHRFKKSVGTTLTDFKNGMKLTKARKLLANSDKSISEIAQECGFGDFSYFSKLFMRQEAMSPKDYRKMLRDNVPGMLGVQGVKYEARADQVLADILPGMRLLQGVDPERLERNLSIRSYMVGYPSEEYQFLNEAAIIQYHGVLFAAWYNCRRLELQGRTPIRFVRSFDQGRTWTEPRVVADEPQGVIMHCPPVFGICEDKLYMMLNEMVGLDYVHSMDLYLYNEEAEQFEQLWTRSVPFKLNTNVYQLPDGRLMLPGRAGEAGDFLNIPGVMISDSGKMDAQWRIVRAQKNGSLPDGSKLIYAESSCIVNGERIYMFCRDDERNVPLMYLSVDSGEHWSGPYAHDIPFSGSKIYSGTLQNGCNYVIGNLQPGRSRLAIFFSEPGTMRFTRGILLQDGFSEELRCGECWHYPAAYESDGRLYIIYTVNMDSPGTRGAVLSVIELDKI